MKFRGVLSEILLIRQFTCIVSSISKLAKSCALRLTCKKVCFIFCEHGSIFSGPSMWCELTQEYFFSEYNLQGVTEEQNEIYLEVATDKLAKTLNSLKSTQSAKTLKVKLTKKHTPCLTFEVELPSHAAHSRICVHDVPVTVIKRSLWNQYQKPEEPHFDVSIYLPSLKQLKNISERMKNISSILHIEATSSGEFTLQVEKDVVKVATHFKDLQTIPTDADLPQHDVKASASVDIKKFLQMLASEETHPNYVLCNVIHERLVSLLVVHEEANITYFLPIKAV